MQPIDREGNKQTNPAHQTAFFFGRPRLNLAGREFFWRMGFLRSEAAFFFFGGRGFFWGRPRIFFTRTANFLSPTPGSVRVFFFGGREFFLADREFFGQGPRIFCHQLRRQSAFLFLFGGRVLCVCIHARAPLVIIRKAGGNSKKCSNRPAKAAKRAARTAQAAKLREDAANAAKRKATRATGCSKTKKEVNNDKYSAKASRDSSRSNNNKEQQQQQQL